MKPVLGKLVLYQAPASDGVKEPMPALVNGLNSDGTVNLVVFPRSGLLFAAHVRELTVDRRIEAGGWFWPPDDNKETPHD